MVDRHFTSTTYVLHPKTPSVLLLWHRKLQSWLPPGGHIELNEDPTQAAIREISEETGLDHVEFIEPKNKIPSLSDERATTLPMPHTLLLETIEEDHYHLDWIFYARAPEGKIVDLRFNGETLKWFQKSDLDSEKMIFANVKELALFGISNFGS